MQKPRKSFPSWPWKSGSFPIVASHPRRSVQPQGLFFFSSCAATAVSWRLLTGASLGGGVSWIEASSASYLEKC